MGDTRCEMRDARWEMRETRVGGFRVGESLIKSRSMLALPDETQIPYGNDRQKKYVVQT